MIDLENGRVNGYEIDGFPIPPESIIQSVTHEIARQQAIAQSTRGQIWDLPREAYIAGSELDLVMPHKLGSWATKLEELAWLPPAKTISNGRLLLQLAELDQRATWIA